MSAQNGPVGERCGLPLPEPTGWTGQRPSGLVKFGVGYLALMVLVLIAVAVGGFVLGDAATGILVAAAAVYMFHVVGFAASAQWPPRRRQATGTAGTAPDGEPGVRFRYSAWPYYWLIALLLLTVLGLLAMAAIAAATATLAGVVIGVAVAVVAALIAWFLVTVVRLAPGAVILTPSGVWHRSLTFNQFVPWQDITQVMSGRIGVPVIVAEATPAPDIRIRRYTGRFGTRELRYLPSVVVNAYWLGADPTSVYHALSYYQAHPELCAELATPDGLRRIAEGRAVRARW
jgi:hypothetical protein